MAQLLQRLVGYCIAQQKPAFVVLPVEAAICCSVLYNARRETPLTLMAVVGDGGHFG